MFDKSITQKVNGAQLAGIHLAIFSLNRKQYAAKWEELCAFAQKIYIYNLM